MSHPNDVVWYLKIEHEEADGVSLLTVTGRISSLTAPDFETRIEACVGSAVRGLILDLAGVDYISSPGLRVLERASSVLARTRRPFVVCGIRDSVGLAFALAGLEQALTIEASRQAAVEKIGTLGRTKNQEL